MEIPAGYFSISQCVQWCVLEREGKQEAFRQALREVRGVAEASARVGASPFVGANTGFPAATDLRNALVSGDLNAAAISEADGNLITVPAKVWRRPMRGTSPFDEAVEGRPIPVRVAPSGAVTDAGAPVVARRDLERWAGAPEADLPAIPAETAQEVDQAHVVREVGASAKAKGRPGTRGVERGGRTVAREVAAAKTALGAKLAAEGVPAHGDGGQAILEKWFLEEVERNGGTLSEGRVRVHVREGIVAHRKAVGRG